MRVVPNPAKEAINRRRHGHDFSWVGQILAGPHTGEPDDRPLGYEHEGRRLITGRVGVRVLVLVIEPVAADGEPAAVRPISLRKATRQEARDHWRECGWPEGTPEGTGPPR